VVPEWQFAKRHLTCRNEIRGSRKLVLLILYFAEVSALLTLIGTSN
jgi:hypothetical protein